MQPRKHIESMKAEKETERDSLQSQINKLQAQLDRISGQIEAFEATLLVLTPQNERPRGAVLNKRWSRSGLQRGGDMAKAYDALKENGKPMHVSEIVKAIGKPEAHSVFASIASQLTSYDRQERYFRKVEPNTFALREWETDDDFKSNGQLPMEDSDQ